MSQKWLKLRSQDSYDYRTIVMARLAKRTDLLPAKRPDVASDVRVTADLVDTSNAAADARVSSSQDRDAMVEHWLQNDVVKTYDAIEVDPSKVISVEAAFDRLRVRYNGPVKDRP